MKAKKMMAKKVMKKVASKGMKSGPDKAEQVRMEGGKSKKRMK